MVVSVAGGGWGWGDKTYMQAGADKRNRKKKRSCAERVYNLLCMNAKRLNTFVWLCVFCYLIVLLDVPPGVRKPQTVQQ